MDTKINLPFSYNSTIFWEFWQ